MLRQVAKIHLVNAKSTRIVKTPMNLIVWSMYVTTTHHVALGHVQRAQLASKNWIIALMTRFAILTALTLTSAGCATPATSSSQSTRDTAPPVFEMQKGEDYFLKEHKAGFWHHAGFHYAAPIPDEPYELYRTQFWNVPGRFVFGLGGPFALEDGKIPVFICDINRRQFYRFGGAILYCPKRPGEWLEIALSENHPHTAGLELAPGKMPQNSVRTLVYIWRDDKIEKIGKDWMTSAYCVAEGGWNLKVWCEPYEP